MKKTLFALVLTIIIVMVFGQSRIGLTATKIKSERHQELVFLSALKKIDLKN